MNSLMPVERVAHFKRRIHAGTFHVEHVTEAAKWKCLNHFQHARFEPWLGKEQPAWGSLSSIALRIRHP
ncbi:hypothetical protein D7V77_28650 [Corallococcus sp. CA041A]|nr:hypothetical protein D7V77_28650 [Corallococcus sp. CA041A]